MKGEEIVRAAGDPKALWGASRSRALKTLQGGGRQALSSVVGVGVQLQLGSRGRRTENRRGPGTSVQTLGVRVLL